MANPDDVSQFNRCPACSRDMMGMMVLVRGAAVTILRLT